MTSRIESLTGLSAGRQLPAVIVACGHAGTHWLMATLYLLLPWITTSLGISYLKAGLLISILHASAFAANIFSGMLVDMVGRRILIQFCALLLGAIAITALGTATVFWLLIPSVVVVGITNNLWHPAAISFLSGRFPDNRGYVLSVHTLGASVGDAIAPLCVGALLGVYSWQASASLAAIPAYALAALLLLSLLRYDSPGEPDGRSSVTLRQYVDGVRTIIANRHAMGLCLMAGFRSMAQNGLLMFIPIYLANELKVSPIVTGLALLGMQLGGLIAGPVAGTLSDRIGRRPVLLAAATATTVVVFGLALAANEIIFIAGVSVLGFALFAMRPVIQSWMMDMTPTHMAGSATSALFGTQSAMSMVIPLAGGLVADRYGVGAVFILLAGCMLLANLLVIFLPKAAPSR